MGALALQGGLRRLCFLFFLFLFLFLFLILSLSPPGLQLFAPLRNGITTTTASSSLSLGGEGGGGGEHHFSSVQFGVGRATA